ncbi:MAG: C39 family peptidase [Opitutaceae bacterium]|nr:C39 family peptidase [Opitutaceae bacterium]
MDGVAHSLTTTPTAAELAHLQTLYDRSLLRDAWELSQRHAPPETWPGHDPAVLAGRLVSNWGDPDTSDRIHRLNFRRHPRSARALLYAGYSKARRHGPFETLRWLEHAMPPTRLDAAPNDWAHLLCLQAGQLAEFRDFTPAHALLDEATTLSPDDPWLACERADILLKQDRYNEALAHVRQALQLRPWYRPAVGALAHLLQLRGGEEEALALLAEATPQLQSGHVRISRFRLLHELGRHAEAETVAADLEHFLPRMPRSHRGWLAGVRADIAYQDGRIAEAARLAAEADGAYFKRMAERLTTPLPEGRRLVLPVPFVRQHHVTCAPATLAAIARFLGTEVDHVALAARITYDGTPDHEERRWAESLGWTVREFRITWGCATALLDCGIPFTMATVATRSAHLQAVIGYDSILGTLIFRDPSQRNHAESLAEELLQQQAPSGPRGMVLVPPSLVGRLEGIELPDAGLFDGWYRLRRALADHDRTVAGLAVDALASTAPTHRLTLWARRELASYDGSVAGQLGFTRQLLELFPEDANLRLSEVTLLRHLGRVEELREILHRRAVHRSADVLLRLEHVTQLGEDAPRSDRTLRQAWRLLHWRPTDGAVLRLCANLLWDRREASASANVYRLAATAAGTNEDYWRSYFIASRHLGDTERALAELRGRHEAALARVPWPTCSYFNALDQLERTTEGFAALAEALRLQPDDVDLRLFAARRHANYGEATRARELLDSLQGRSRRVDWLRAAAAVARCEIDHRAGLGHWQSILAIEPLDSEAQGEVARLLEVCSGRDAALAHVAAERDRRPYFVPLHTLFIQRLREAPAGERLTAIEALLSRDPDNAWARRERALVYLHQQRFAEAMHEAEAARTLDPHAPHPPALSETSGPPKGAGRKHGPNTNWRCACTSAPTIGTAGSLRPPAPANSAWRPSNSSSAKFAGNRSPTTRCCPSNPRRAPSCPRTSWPDDWIRCGSPARSSGRPGRRSRFTTSSAASWRRRSNCSNRRWKSSRCCRACGTSSGRPACDGIHSRPRSLRWKRPGPSIPVGPVPTPGSPSPTRDTCNWRPPSTFFASESLPIRSMPVFAASSRMSSGSSAATSPPSRKSRKRCCSIPRSRGRGSACWAGTVSLATPTVPSARCNTCSNPAPETPVSGYGRRASSTGSGPATLPCAPATRRRCAIPACSGRTTCAPNCSLTLAASTKPAWPAPLRHCRPSTRTNCAVAPRGLKTFVATN